MKLNILVFLLIVCLLIGMLHATTDTIGGVSSGSDYWCGAGNCGPFVLKIQASASGAIQTIGINVATAKGNLDVAIYTDNGVGPQTLLGNSISTIMQTGWNDLNIPQAPSITQTSYYWLAFRCDDCGNGGAYFYYASITDIWSNSGNYHISSGSYPNPFVGTWGRNDNYNERMVYVSTSTSTTSSTSTSTTSSTTSSTTTIPQIINEWSSISPINQGDIQTLNIEIDNTFPPFSYNFFVYNTITLNIIFNQVNINSLTQNTVSFIVPQTTDAIGTVGFIANIVDNQHLNIIQSNTFIIDSTTSTSTSSTSTSTTSSTSTSTTSSTSTSTTSSTSSTSTSTTSTSTQTTTIQTFNPPCVQLDTTPSLNAYNITKGQNALLLYIPSWFSGQLLGQSIRVKITGYSVGSYATNTTNATAGSLETQTFIVNYVQPAMILTSTTGNYFNITNVNITGILTNIYYETVAKAQEQYIGVRYSSAPAYYNLWTINSSTLIFVNNSCTPSTSTSTIPIVPAPITIAPNSPITVPSNMQNSSSANIMYMITYTLALPYFPIALILLAVGIVEVSLRKFNLAIFSGLITSLLIFAINLQINYYDNTTLLYFIGGFVILMIFAELEELFTHRNKGNEGNMDLGIEEI